MSLLNAPVAGDIDTTNMPGWARINGLVPMVTGAGRIDITETAAVAEVKQELTLVAATAIVASTKYQIKGGRTSTRTEGAMNQLQPFGSTSNAILVSTAIDKHNVYVSLAYKINHALSLKVSAYPLITVAQTNTTPFAENEIVTETVSGATGINLKTVAGAAAGTTGTLTIGVISGTWSGIATGTATAGTLTGSLGGLSTSTAHVTVAGIGLRLIDTATYYDVEQKNGGASSWFVSQGFATTDLTVTTAAVYGEGQGAELLNWIYRTEPTSGNRASGMYAFANNEVPVTGRAYQRFDIAYHPTASDSALTELTSGGEFRQRIYLYTGAGGYAATRTALLALDI